MNHLDMFSGIGGFALATESVWPEVEHIFCDNDLFCQAILKKHWPQSKIYDDIKEFKGKEIGPVDLLTGGFPCQPFSAAGKRRGTEDDRHLWPEMLRVIRETSPSWVIGENVGGLLTWNGGMVLNEVFSDLEAEGYEVWAFIIPACAQNAPHRRDRVWIVANIKSKRSRGSSGKECGNEKRLMVSPKQRWRETRSESKGCTGDAPHSKSRQSRKSAERKGWQENWFKVATRLCPLDDGLPNGLARPKGWRNAALKGAGNAIVPQIAEVIMRHIKTIHEGNK